jgi:hypothetical protein
MVRIAFEKAGIARRGSPLVTQSYPEAVELEIERLRRLAGAPLHMRGYDWWAAVGETIAYHDRHGDLTCRCRNSPAATRATTPRSRSPCCATRSRCRCPRARWPKESAPPAGPRACSCSAQGR